MGNKQTIKRVCHPKYLFCRRLERLTKQRLQQRALDNPDLQGQHRSPLSGLTRLRCVAYRVTLGT